MKLITVTGPSGVGKGYLKDGLKRRWPEKIRELPWYTTRPMRENELHRNDRINLSAQEYDLLERRGTFVVTDTVAGNNYGLSDTSVPGRMVGLTELRPHLLGRIRCDDTFTIGLTATPDFLSHRLTRRGTEIKTEIAKRIDVAKGDVWQINEMRDHFSLFYHVDETSESSIIVDCINAISHFMTQ